MDNHNNTLRKGRDIESRTFRFAFEVVKFCRLLDSRPGVSRTLARQLLRAGTSVRANVEEAQAGQSRADFISKYLIALKEARETSYWLRLLTESGEARPEASRWLQQEGAELARILGASVVSAKRGGARS